MHARNLLANVPAADSAEVAADLKAIFSVHRVGSATAPVDAFTARYQKRFAKAIATLKNGLSRCADVAGVPVKPSSAVAIDQRIHAGVNGLERLFGEMERRTRVVGVLPHEASATNPCSAVMLRSNEE